MGGWEVRAGRPRRWGGDAAARLKLGVVPRDARARWRELLRAPQITNLAQQRGVQLVARGLVPQQVGPRMVAAELRPQLGPAERTFARASPSLARADARALAAPTDRRGHRRLGHERRAASRERAHGRVAAGVIGVAARRRPFLALAVLAALAALALALAARPRALARVAGAASKVPEHCGRQHPREHIERWLVVSAPHGHELPRERAREGGPRLLARAARHAARRAEHGVVKPLRQLLLCQVRGRASTGQRVALELAAREVRGLLLVWLGGRRAIAF